ncbi:MAG TPA: SDR family oxidoreductase, partial [Candidatus Brocadiia bacterium]|nr:SDR family oxidoreductase [Candidatus Brocadiia bacterium]
MAQESTLRLSGRAALVTGASGGIGAAIARRLAAEGAAVALLSRRQDVCAERAAEIEAAGGKAVALAADVASEESLREAVKAAGAALGRLDIVCASAGVEVVKPFTTLRAEDWEQALKVNLVGAANAVQAAMPFLARQGGAVVFVSSVAALGGAPLLAPYAAAKGALISLCRALAKELAPRRIRVNAIAPGMVRTEMFARITRRWTPEQLEAATGDRWASISARLRDFRKAMHGGHTVERERVKDGGGTFR